MFIKSILILLCSLICTVSYNQEVLYDMEHIQEIRITFDEDNWDEILDDFHIAGNKERLAGDVTINGTLIEGAGIRYKGFSSVSVDRVKNPFNIKLDYTDNNAEYDGINKIKLSNVIQDPSFLREVLAYDLARQYMPAGLANFANVYVNDIHLGLYTNVEAVNKDFVEKHFGSRQNAFFKGQPEELDFDGENANLSNSHGSDPLDYEPYYDIESDEGWNELYQLIITLNENTDQIESILNVDRTLWMHALNYVMVNFDSYIGFAQNYYLYQDNNGRFNPILWDLNQSFGSFRLTDASENFDGFSVEGAQTIDPLLHYSSISIVPRPLMRKLFEHDRYRKMYMAHIRTIVEENFANAAYKASIAVWQSIIEADVLSDENKFYSNQDFYDNATQTVVDLVAYPGLTDLMDNRSIYLQNYDGYQGSPSYIEFSHAPQTFQAGDTVLFQCSTAEADSVFLSYRFNTSDVFSTLAMYDDGMHGDGAASDGMFGVELENVDNIIQFYFFAENSTSGRFSPEAAAYKYHAILSDATYDGIVINELLSSNTNGSIDEQGEYEDWIELYNNANNSISTTGLYLSDDQTDLKQWSLLSLDIAAGDYLTIWADDEPHEGNLHATFKLSNSGESLYLSTETGEIIDSITFPNLESDLSFSRIPNGTGPFELTPTTFGMENSLSSNLDEATDIPFNVSPNPASNTIHIDFKEPIAHDITIYTFNGKKIYHAASNHTIERLDICNIENGVYILQVINQYGIYNSRILIEQ